MIAALSKTRADQISRLHADIQDHLRTTLDHAIQIGELLAAQKADLEHGQWLPWLRDNAPFSERVARDYIRFYERREELKTASLADLSDARRYLSEPEGDSYPMGDPESCQRLIEGIADKWPEDTPEQVQRKIEWLTTLTNTALKSAQVLGELHLRAMTRGEQ